MTVNTPTMQFIEPDWPAPASVLAFTTSRALTDESLVMRRLPENSRVCRLRQVHGNGVVEALAGIGGCAADACFSRDPLYACRVLTADCLPLLICNQQGTEVAAVHAGWRGLAAGVVENCIAQLRTAPEELLVWFGPAISQLAFEVGEEVLEEFSKAAAAPLRPAIRACFRAGAPGKYFADLYALARLRLQSLGVTRVFGGDYCTWSQPELFHSYRRDGSRGRMISVIVFR